jgi:membrane associated rhomboid family serine protease
MGTNTQGGGFVTGYGEPPQPLLTLIYATVGLSVFAGLTESFLRGTLGWFGLHQLLGLSWSGISTGMIWQPLSYVLVHHGASGLSLGFFLELLFPMYILYMMGTLVWERLESKRFFLLYFGAGLLAGVTHLAMTALTGINYPLMGSTPAVYGVLTLWAMLYPETELLLFFALRLAAKWLIVIVLGVSVLIDLSHGNVVGISTTLAGSVAGYFYGLIALDLRGPFVQTHRFDAVIASVGQKFQQRQQRTQAMMQDAYRKAKVFDLQTGEAILDDEEFVDVMLTKISKYGENSLTRKERKRMKAISTSKTRR